MIECFFCYGFGYVIYMEGRQTCEWCDGEGVREKDEHDED